jgi:RNA polymerase sigma factor (sigma-70 family)
MPYVRTAVVNRCRSWGRRQRLEHDRRPAPPDPAGLDADELWDALLRLEPRRRAAVVLRFYLDLPDAEIAELLGCRRATVRTSIHRALHTLRQEIDR